jgi:enterochelin esterase-like enzyme
MRFSDSKKSISQRMAMAMLVLVSLVAFAALTGCGSSSGSSGRFVAFLENPTSAGAVIAHSAHTTLKHSPSAATHKAAVRAAAQPANISIAAGTQDLMIVDTHTKKTDTLATGLD